MSRRAPTHRGGLLCGTAASALLTIAPAAGPAKAEELDGDLIALLDEARAVMRAAREAPADPRPPTLESLMAPPPWSAPMHAAARLPARTPEGLRAKAETVAAWLAGDDWRTSAPWDCTRETAIAWSLLRDLLPDLAPVPPPKRTPTVAELEAMRAAMLQAPVLPEVPDIPWMWSNAAKAIRALPVQGAALVPSCLHEARRAEAAGDRVRAHNLLLAASAAVQQAVDGLGVEIAFNTDFYPDAAALGAAGMGGAA